jgi:hypothetical protein
MPMDDYCYLTITHAIKCLRFCGSLKLSKSNGLAQQSAGESSKQGELGEQNEYPECLVTFISLAGDHLLWVAYTQDNRITFQVTHCKYTLLTFCNTNKKSAFFVILASNLYTFFKRPSFLFGLQQTTPVFYIFPHTL